MPKRIAIIDLGTNTFHLLIAEQRGNGFDIVHRDRVPVKIGMGGINKGIITDVGAKRALEAMIGFREVIREYGIDRVYAFGTSALRNARNADDVTSTIKEHTGITVDLIPGHLEAEYIYYGVRAALDYPRQPYLVVDIGGGSVEFIIASEDRLLWKESFEIGAQRLLEEFHRHDPILPEEVAAVNEHFEKRLGSLLNALSKYNPGILAGSSGTFDTLSEIFCIRNHITKSPDDKETPLSIEGFRKIHHELLQKNREQRMAVPGMIEMRVDMIVVACCLIEFILNRHPFETIRVSTWSLKEGVLTYLNEHGRI